MSNTLIIILSLVIIITILSIGVLSKKTNRTSLKTFLSIMFTSDNSVCKKIGRFIKRILSLFKTLYKEVIAYPAFILTHPVDGWQSFKQEKRGKMKYALTILGLYVVMEMLAYKYLGPVVNTNNPYKFNSIIILVYGIMPSILLSVANWSVTALMDGKGKMKEIFMMACYSYFPVMIIGYISIIASNFITIDEAQFLTLLTILGYVLTGFMAITGLMSIHEYGLGKVFGSIFATIIATAIISFLALLVFNLAEQIYAFIYQVYEEFSTRYM